MWLASSAGISLRNRVVGKTRNFFSKPIRRLKRIERPAEEAIMWYDRMKF